MPSKDWEKVKGEAGIYRRLRKTDNSKYEYLLVYTLGYTEEFDEKKGKMRTKQNVSQKIFPTIKEAKSYRGGIHTERQPNVVVDVSRKLHFDECYEEFIEFHKPEWSLSNYERNSSYGKRLLAYFGKTDPRTITTLDVLEFFRWCREPHKED